MQNIDIVIRESGLLEKFNCTVQDIKNSYFLYAQSWVTESRRDRPMDYDFLEMMGQMQGSIEDIDECSRRNIQRRDDYIMEEQIQKANGTYDQWSRQISEIMPGEAVESIFAANRLPLRPNSNLPRFS